MIKLNFYKDKRQGNVNYGKIYARAKNNKPIDIDGLAKHIAQHGSPYTKDVIIGVLSKIAGCIRELVLDGYPVKIADLCIFTPAVTTVPADDVEAFSLNKRTKDDPESTGNIVNVRMLCRATGDATRKKMTADAKLGYTDLAERIKKGEITLSGRKGEYIAGDGE